jgi:hypothetical protein
VTKAKDYLVAYLSDSSTTGADGKPLSQEEQTATKALVDATLDGNIDALTKTGQEIMKNPKLAKSIEAVLDPMQFGQHVISFKTDGKGNPCMVIGAYSSFYSQIVVPASGQAYAARFDIKGNFTNYPADFHLAVQAASDWSVDICSTPFENAQVRLKQNNLLPADGYTNMKDLERAYSKTQKIKASPRNASD